MHPELTGRLLDLLAEGGGAESGGSAVHEVGRIDGGAQLDRTVSMTLMLFLLV
ncbi:MAG: hypothetical protein LBV60_09515 [Streptomyces sp.]|nr:hypothetical protein [Streptomyces sp.]